ncbi:hypothetical protein, partial [Aeromonas caviae]
MAKALMARLARLESLESVQMPTVIEYHRVVSVRSDDHRRGSCVVQGNEMTFFASSAAEWLITSCRSANNIMPITFFLPAFIASS